MSHDATFPATCLATLLRDKLQEKLRVWHPLSATCNATKCCVASCRKSRTIVYFSQRCETSCNVWHVTATCLAILTQFLMENEFWLARSRGPKSKMASLLTFDPNKAQCRKLSDPEKVELLGELQQRPCLWKSGGPWTKKEKNDALDELCLKLNVTSDTMKKAIHSLRSSMSRELKRSKEQQNYVSTWKFTEHAKFLEEEIVKSLQQESRESWTDDETITLIEFYKENPLLWNHCLPEYKDRNLKRLAFERLKDVLVNHSDEDVKSHWHSLKTIFDREEKRQRGSKKSGASSAEVYKTNWKYFNLLTFTKDCADFDPSKSTMNLTSGKRVNIIVILLVDGRHVHESVKHCNHNEQALLGSPPSTSKRHRTSPVVIATSPGCSGE